MHQIQSTTKQTHTNYRKENWTQFTTDTEAADIQPPPDIHIANTIFTNIILHAEKHNITKRQDTLNIQTTGFPQSWKKKLSWKVMETEKS